jgi:hypothetical protein
MRQIDTHGTKAPFDTFCPDVFGTKVFLRKTNKNIDKTHIIKPKKYLCPYVHEVIPQSMNEDPLGSIQGQKDKRTKVGLANQIIGLS